MKPAQFIKRLTVLIQSLKTPHPLRVGIDGVDASGKTTLADFLAKELAAKNGNVIRASVDGFHNPKSTRYQKGEFSPEGYYRDSFNTQAIIDNLLQPLGPHGNLRFRRRIFDCKGDAVVQMPFETAETNSILLFDGVFLFRPELLDYWDLKIFIEADFAVTLARALQRDGFLGSASNILERYNRRYVPGQRLYFKEAKPKEKADIIINNNDFRRPNIITRWERFPPSFI